MKNTFRYIAAFAALVSGFAVYAQNLADDVYKEENHIAYAKRAILNDDGTYTIDLETFVTGEVTQTFESTPADVVLVLDVSLSMEETISSIDSYNVADVSSITYYDYAGYGGSGTYQTDYYYYYNNDYCRVSVGRGGNGGNRRYFLSFTSKGTTLYINNQGQVVSDQPSGVSDRYSNLLHSSVQLFEVVTTTTQKMDALKSAVRAFLSAMNKNDLVDPITGVNRSERLGNRIAIVAFSGAGTLGNSNHDNSIQLNTGWETLGDTVADSTGLVSLKTDLQGLTPTGGTHVEYGMQDALALIQDSEAEIRTVVVFTDGVPGAGSWDGAGKGANAQRYITETVNSANDAIGYSQQINAITIGSGEDATNPYIYAVGLFDEKPTTGTNTYVYMNYLSSNYPDASSMTSGGDKDSDDFYLDASGGTAEDLADIFVAIAHHSGGSQNTNVSGGSTLTVDVVSSSFSVPQGFEDNPENAIEVLVAPCNSITTINGKDYLLFGEAKAPSEYGLAPITPSISEEDNKVTTTGFDYSTNWCGPDPTSTSAIHNFAYHGFKQIIRFTITVKDDAVGGPGVETNDPNSGIYLPNATEPLIKFNRPTVKIPVQIWIQKQGLKGDESAVFNLRRIKYRGTYETDENGDYILDANDNPIRIKYEDIPKKDWETFTKVVINNEDMDDNGMVKIVGLDPDYVYRLDEDAWAFGYTYQDGGIQYTIGDNIENPFIFINIPENKKFDEASARNIFNERTTQ